MAVPLNVDPTLGRMIRAARLARGWTIDDLSVELGRVGDPPKALGRTKLTRLEQGQRNVSAEEAWGLVELFEELDAWIPRLDARVREDDLIIITADHGNDPTTPSTDHSREAVPILALGPRVRPTALGERSTFADLGATVAEYFGVSSPPLAAGTSFLAGVWA